MALTTPCSMVPALASPAAPSPLPTGSSVTTSSSLTPSLSTSTDSTTRCRYKTGRCTNARVVKPNGSLLLLCEFHRDQQNRTKKRSDMKYRHHRASKRQFDKRAPVDGNISSRSTLHIHLRHATSASTSQATALSSPLPPPPSCASLARPSLAREQLPHLVSNPVGLSPGRQPLQSAALQKAALFKLSSGLRAAHTGSCISPGKLRIHAGMRDAFAASRRDIVAMASPANKLAPSAAPLSPVVFPPCLSPLQQPSSPWAEWHPDDLRLLEYFVL